MLVNTITSSSCTPQTIVIGRRGTYDTMQIAFDLTYLVENYGSGTAVLAIKRSQDESAYPAVAAQENNMLTWTVSETDTYYVGSGECQLMWYVDGGLAKTIIYPMVVMRDILATSEEAPDAYQTWVDDLTALGAETLQNAQNAAQSASEAENAKDDAVDAKEAAEEAAETAQEAVVHAPIIQNGYWYIWNDGQYVDTGVRAEGQKGDKGDTGEKGDTGNGIASITKTGTSGLVDTYTVTYTDGTSTTFTVTNGAKGDKGDTGATGNGIASIAKTGTSGNVDTYTITYTNGQTTTFTVTNGAVSSVAGKTGAVVLDSGDIGYDSTETYQSGTVGAELGDLTRQLSDVEDVLEIPEEEHFSATSDHAWAPVTDLGTLTLKKGVTYTFDFNVASVLGYGVYVYIRDVALDSNIWSSSIASDKTSESYTYLCTTENQQVKCRFQSGSSASTTVNVDITTDEVGRLDRIEERLVDLINYGNTLFTSKENALGTQTDSAHATCYKRKRDTNVTGVKFACSAYYMHTYFCAFDNTGAVIEKYSLSGATSTSVEHSVEFGDDVAYYSVMTLKTAKANSYLKETLNSFGTVIIENEEKSENFDDKTYIAIKNIEMEKWSEMQLGMFIHWGMYSAWAGVYDGPNIDGETIHVTGGTEWMWQQNKIPKANYMAKSPDFTGAEWNPEYICQLAKKLNMKQIVITARHHEGFSLMETDHCEWDITDSSCTRDVLMELKEACIRHNLKFSLYVSPLMDWCDDGGFGQQAWHDGDDPYSWSQHHDFVEEQLLYLNQLVEKYDPYVIWYDGGTYVSVPDDMKEIFNANQMRNYPYIIVNNRGEGIFDYKLAENTYADHPNTTEKYERCWFLRGWGYNTGADYIANYHTPTQVIWDMLENMGRGFNYLLNISPKGDGSIPSPTETVFDGVSAIMKKYTFFNGAKRVFNYCQPSWGRPIYVNGSLYMFILPGHSGEIYLDSISTDNIKGVHVYGIQSPDSDSNYDIISGDQIKIMNVPTSSVDYFSVVRIDFFNDLNCADYNIVDDKISGLSMVRTVYNEWATTTTCVLMDGTYRFGTDETTSISKFKFDGTTGTYSFTPNGTQSGTVSFSYKLYDGFMNLISDSSPFTLTNGDVYIIEVNKTGSGTYIMDSLDLTDGS